MTANLFFTLFICEQLCNYVFSMCHILLSISINFIVGLDLILMHNIYTFNLLSRAIVDSLDVNLFQYAITLCLCTELNIQQIYFSNN